MATEHKPLPRLLLVEDDPISRGFLVAALEALPAVVHWADSLASALERGREHYDAWLIDVHLPDGSGTELLQLLRRKFPDTPALAHTAEAVPAFHVSLEKEGFAEVLVKPISSERLHHAVRRTLARVRGGLHTPIGAAAPAMLDWDEAAALAALNGQQHHLLALRELFLAELPGTRDAVASALRVSDERALRDQLHRLQASCGFVGAARLAGAVRQLRGDPQSTSAQTQFHEAVAALLH